MTSSPSSFGRAVRVKDGAKGRCAEGETKAGTLILGSIVLKNHDQFQGEYEQSIE